MQKNVPVVDMTIDVTGYIAKLKEVFDARRLPVGINVYKTGIDRKALNDWWTGRSIPASRSGIDAALQSIGVASPTLLLEKCCGLSLSDQYWIYPKGSGLRWENVNFFQNDFSKDMGEILFGHEPQDPARVSLMSPDNTSDGWLRKKWIIADGKRYLMKGGSFPYHQEPFNEAIASAVMRRLGVSHVDYTLTVDGDNPYSLCENFITPETELVPAWRVMQTQKLPNDRSTRDHFLVCCEALSVPGVKAALDRMLTVDYIISNEDRHYNNFGCVRNADTLEWLGLAPVFDSGTSLWYNRPGVGGRVESKPFRKHHDDQIKLVDDLSWFDIGVLNGLDEEIADIFTASQEVDAGRRTAIAKAVLERAGQIELLQSEQKKSVIAAIREHKRDSTEMPRSKSNRQSRPER
jgi:hypothetical protein